MYCLHSNTRVGAVLEVKYEFCPQIFQEFNNHEMSIKVSSA